MGVPKVACSHHLISGEGKCAAQRQVSEQTHLQIDEQQSGLFIRLHADVFKDARPNLRLEQLLVQLYRLPRAQLCILNAVVQVGVALQGTRASKSDQPIC